MSSSQEALEATLAVLAVKEARVFEFLNNNDTKYSIWHWFTMFDNVVCEACDSYKGDEYELEDSKDLELMFPYGYFEDEFTFRPMIHPNDRCRIERVRDYDFDNELIKR